MAICNKNIIECLRDKGVSPDATSRQVYSNCKASNAIDYSTANYESGTSGEQWWKIDFKQTVSIGLYQIFTLFESEACDWIRKWKASIAIADGNWKVVDEPAEGTPQGNVYHLNKSYSARYFKIDNVSPNKCGYKMVFRYIKFFGALNPKQIFRSCVRRHEISHNIMILIALIYS